MTQKFETREEAILKHLEQLEDFIFHGFVCYDTKSRKELAALIVSLKEPEPTAEDLPFLEEFREAYRQFREWDKQREADVDARARRIADERIEAATILNINGDQPRCVNEPYKLKRGES